MDPLGVNPWWTLLVAALPALLCTILIFMDQQITAVIINRKEHKLKVRPAFVLSGSVIVSLMSFLFLLVVSISSLISSADCSSAVS